MFLYCVSYIIKIDRNENKKKFFCFATDEVNAIKRFCEITGQTKDTITDIKEVEEWES